MSASPPAAATQSQKRPLEEPSSPAAGTGQPDAKRQALDKVLNGGDDEQTTAYEIESKGESTSEDILGAKAEQPDATGTVEDVPKQNGVKVGEEDTVITDVAPATAAQTVLETQPIQSTASVNGRSGESNHNHQDESKFLWVRAIISSAEAATIIGKGGENVTLIRKMSGARCTVSDYSRGAVERILTVSGPVDALAKVSNPSLALYRCHY
jgi:heterogeneous nuclear rnp K-like protein